MQAAMSQSRKPSEAASQSTDLMAAIALVAVAGVAVSSVSLYEHFATSTTSFCNFSDVFNCDLVNRSEYSRVLGVPVALIGIVGYYCSPPWRPFTAICRKRRCCCSSHRSSDWDLLSIWLTLRSFCWECGAFFV